VSINIGIKLVKLKICELKSREITQLYGMLHSPSKYFHRAYCIHARLVPYFNTNKHLMCRYLLKLVYFMFRQQWII